MNYFKKIRIFFNFNSQMKLLILECVFLLALNRFLLLTVKFKKLSKNLGVSNDAISHQYNNKGYVLAKKVSFIINKVAPLTPWKSECLVQSMTAQRMMKKRGYSTQLYLGVTKSSNSLLAHSWLRYGDFYITGGNGSNFTILSTFYNI